MSLTRRNFLKILGGGVLATVAAPILGQGIANSGILVTPRPTAPLFIPATNLDFGVPRQILTATEMPTAPPLSLIPESVQRETIEHAMSRTVPMMLLQDNYIPTYGGRLRAGSTLLVDQETATRWAHRGVAVAPDGSTPHRVIPGRDAIYSGIATPQEWRRLTRPHSAWK